MNQQKSGSKRGYLTEDNQNQSQQNYNLSTHHQHMQSNQKNSSKQQQEQENLIYKRSVSIPSDQSAEEYDFANQQQTFTQKQNEILKKKRILQRYQKKLVNQNDDVSEILLYFFQKSRIILFRPAHKIYLRYVQKTIRHIIMPWVILLNSFLSIINMILISYVQNDKIQGEDAERIQLMELAIGAIFIIEFFYYFIYSKTVKWKENQFIFERCIEIANIFEILYMQWNPEDRGLVAFLKIFRSLRCQKIRSIIRFVQIEKFNYDNYLSGQESLIDNNNDEKYFKDDNSFNNFLFSSCIDLTNGIFIESTIVLAVDRFRNFQAFTEEMEYIGSAYYILVNFSTIGYGDIYPIDWFSRLAMVILLIFNITVTSEFMGNFSEILAQVSIYDTSYPFKDHIVLIGEFEDYFVADFCAEIAEVDLIEVKQSEQVREGTKIIVVGEDNPSNQVRGILSYYENGEQYDNEVVYLKADIYSRIIFLQKTYIWQRKSNLEFARHILAVSLRFAEDQREAEEMDLKLIQAIKFIKDFNPLVKITLVLQTNIALNFKQESKYQDVTVCQIQELNQYLVANSIENQGFSTILTHILTMKSKNKPQQDNSTSIYSTYVKEMDQEVYEYVFPPVFYQKTFQHCANILYIYSLQLDSDSGLCQKNSNDEHGLLLIAVQTIISGKTEILINPQNYIIKEGDIGFVICEDYASVTQILDFSSEQMEQFEIYQKNKFYLDKTTQDQAKIQRLLSQMYQNQFFKLSNFKMDEEMKTLKKAKPKQTDLNYFNLFEKQWTNKRFQGHVILVAKMSSFKNIVNILRKQTDKPIILYSNKDLDELYWYDIVEKHENIYYVYGSFCQLEHIEDLNITKCHKVLIMSDKNGIIFNDSDVIVLVKIIFDHFQCPQFLIELRDEQNIKFISIDPNATKFFDPYHGSNECPKTDAAPFFWRSFVQGNVFFAFVSATVLARNIYNKYWMNFIYKLIVPQDAQTISRYIENKLVNSIIITEEVAQQFELYGVLQYALMNHHPSIISIGLIKNEINNRARLKQNGIFLTGFSGYSLKDIKNILFKYGDFVAVLTNPSFYTQIEAGDTLIVLGLDDIENQSQSMKFVAQQHRNHQENRMRIQQTNQTLNTINTAPSPYLKSQYQFQKNKSQASLDRNMKTQNDYSNSIEHNQELEFDFEQLEMKIQEKSMLIEHLKDSNQKQENWAKYLLYRNQLLKQQRDIVPVIQD